MVESVGRGEAPGMSDMKQNETPEEEAARVLGEYLEGQVSSAPAPRPQAAKAEPVTGEAPDNVVRMPEGAEREERKNKRKKKGNPPPPRQFKRLPDDCPVKPLGLNGDLYAFLDANGQLIERSAGWLTQIGVDALFASEEARLWLEATFPRIGEGGRVNGIDREAVRAALMVACGELSKRGVWQARERVREAGAWSKGEALILHNGDHVMIYEKGEKPRQVPFGLHMGLVFPLSQRQPTPALPADAQDGDDGPAARVFAWIKTWRWERGELDAAMLLGWLGSAMIGGALPWRPAGWVMGESGAGKSALQRLIRALLGGDEAYVGAEDGSAASTWQRLERMSLPALFDEIEADADNRKKQAIVELMRQAASGGLIARGGADHKATVFRIQSSFLFSSVNPLPLQPQDLTRLCHFEALPFLDGAEPPIFDWDEVHELGRRLRARIVKGWPSWKDHLAPWWKAIQTQIGRQGNRMADTFGTLLAMQHMLLHDAVAEESDIEFYLKDLIPYLRMRAEVTGSDSERMLKRLCQKAVKVDEGDVRTEAPLRALIYIAADRARPQDMKPNDMDSDMFLPNIGAQAARRILSRWGLGVVRIRNRKTEDDPPEGVYLAFAGADHTELQRVFAGSHWQQGGWLTAAKRLEGSWMHKVRFDQKTEWARIVPIRHVLDVKDEAEEGGDGTE